MNVETQHVGKLSVDVLNMLLNTQQIPLQVAQAGKTQLDFPFEVSSVKDKNAFPQIIVNTVSCSSHYAPSLFSPAHCSAMAFAIPGNVLLRSFALSGLGGR